MIMLISYYKVNHIKHNSKALVATSEFIYRNYGRVTASIVYADESVLCGSNVICYSDWISDKNKIEMGSVA